LAAVERFLADADRHQVVTVNSDFVRQAEAHRAHRQLFNVADLAVADGIPLLALPAGDSVPKRGARGFTALRAATGLREKM